MKKLVLLLSALCAAPAWAQPFKITAIYTNLSGHPTSAVPGLPGVSFEPGLGVGRFGPLFGSPNGNWILKAKNDQGAVTDEMIIVNGVVMLREDGNAPWAPGSKIDTLSRVHINDAGDFALATTTDETVSADEYVVRYSGGAYFVVAREGDPIAALPGTTYGFVRRPALLGDGSVGFESDSIGGAAPTEDNIIILQDAVIARTGVTVPGQQLGAETYKRLGTPWASADGVHYLFSGELNGSLSTSRVLTVNGSVEIQAGTILPGSGFSSPVGPFSFGVHMTADGRWFARGANDDGTRWVHSNLGLVASSGDPIVPDQSELWGSSFVLNVGNTRGDFVIAGTTDADSSRNRVLVINNESVVVRRGTPIDLDGNGVFDDDANILMFGADDAHLTDDLILYGTALIQNDAGSSRGEGFFAIDLDADDDGVHDGVDNCLILANPDQRAWTPGSWADGNYDANTVVTNKGALYQCTSNTQAARWCGLAGYEPGGGGAGAQVWTKLGDCENVEPACTADTWSPGVYSAGARVVANGVEYICRDYPFSGWCGQVGFEPGVSPFAHVAWESGRDCP